MKLVTYTLDSGNKYIGNIDGKQFYIGSRVSYDGRKGLMNVQGLSSQKYDSSAWREKYGFWADFIQPTASCEGALYHTLNTYDRGRFTFSFLQYAAHVPNGDFVSYLRLLLTLPLAKDYFSDLEINNGRVCKRTDTGLINLEDDNSTEGLMGYLNPTSSQIEDVEIIQSAKFVHWIQNDPLHQALIVEHGIQFFKQKMHNYAIKYHLDGQSDTVCVAIADILHQGRGNTMQIISALSSSDPMKNLLDIGSVKYPERIKTLDKEIKRLTATGVFGSRKYSILKDDFI